MLASAVAFERFEAVARRHPQVIQPACDLQLPELAPRDGLDARESLDSPAAREGLSIRILERRDHEIIITRRVITVKRDYLRRVGQ